MKVGTMKAGTMKAGAMKAGTMKAGAMKAGCGLWAHTSFTEIVFHCLSAPMRAKLCTIKAACM